LILSQEELANKATDIEALLEAFFDAEESNTVEIIACMPMDVAADRNTGELLSAKAYLSAVRALRQNLRSYTQNYDIQVMREKKWQTK